MENSSTNSKFVDFYDNQIILYFEFPFIIEIVS